LAIATSAPASPHAFPLGGVVQHDADLLFLTEQCLGDDLACIPRSTNHNEHFEPLPRCTTLGREEETYALRRHVSNGCRTFTFPTLMVIASILLIAADSHDRAAL
jgi:hypothetical protein